MQRVAMVKKVGLMDNRKDKICCLFSLTAHKGMKNIHGFIHMLYEWKDILCMDL